MLGYLTNVETAAESPGTYAACWLKKDSASKLFHFYEDKIKNLEPASEFHITTTSSKVPVPKLVSKPIHFVIPKETFSLTTLGETGEYLVLKVKHNNLDGLFNYAMKNGAISNYPVYIPHVSLSTKFSGDYSKLPVPDFDLEVDNYKVDELKD